MLKTVRVSGKGQIAIPLMIRNALNISKGDELVLIQVNNQLLIEKTNQVEKRAKDDFRDITKFSEQALKDIWDNKDDEVWNQLI